MGEPRAVTVGDLETLFAECRGEMTGKARALLASAEVPECVADADDVVSTAFAKALRDPAVLREPRAWLYQVIRTDVAYLARRGARRGELEERRVADPLRVDPPVVADFSALVVNRTVVHKAVLELSAQQRIAVWATHALDYTRNEAAVLMGKQPGTVARHSSRALLLLRASIAMAVVGVVAALGIGIGARRKVLPADDAGEDPVVSAPLWGVRQGVVVVAVVAIVLLGAWALWALWARRGRVRLVRLVRTKAGRKPRGSRGGRSSRGSRGRHARRRRFSRRNASAAPGRVQNGPGTGGAPSEASGVRPPAHPPTPGGPGDPAFPMQMLTFNDNDLRAAWLRAVEQVGPVPEPTRIDILPGHVVLELTDRDAWEQFEPRVRQLTSALRYELGQCLELIVTFERPGPGDRFVQGTRARMLNTP
ncbi:RNA polymerase sigma factor [Streptomyces lasiicapitis]|uniref:RNA polymerase sigma factor n=1 Tax=Streptomyces lasiicapitis TaxID=1923961 RepID=UPI0036BEFC05